MNIFKNLMMKLQVARLKRELHMLSDRSLADIGIERHEINNITSNSFSPEVVPANSNAHASAASSSSRHAA